MSSLGMNVSRVDGPAKIRGWAQYTADVELPGMVYAKVLRSTYPHAKLVRVDVSKAEKLPGVVAVLTGRFKGDERLFWAGGEGSAGGGDRSGEVRGGGDSGGSGEGRDIAEEALDLIEVEYEALPAVFDPIEAMNRKPQSSIPKA